MTTATAPRAYTVQYVDHTGTRQVARHTNRADAWAFMRWCDGVGLSAGFPSLGPVAA